VKRAEIIAVGSELLLGQIVNTNAQYIAKQLSSIGISHHYQTVVGDNAQRLQNTLEVASSRCDIIILTGGLGPTKDDLTKEVVAEFLGKSLVMHQKSLDSIEAYFKRVNREMTENNKKQALVIEDSFVFENNNGMAPGMCASFNNKQYILLPGPPKEMKPMFEELVLPFLLNGSNQATIVSKELKFFGIGESILETKVLDLLENQSNPTIAPLASEGEVMLRLTASAKDIEEADKLIHYTEMKIKERVGQYIYSTNGDSLFTVLIKQLKEKSMTLAAAESLTGGLFSKHITDIPGVSSIFKGSIVCYQNEIKANILGVSEDILNTKGAVSFECAKMLAENVQKLTHSTIGVSFTGEAGPEVSEQVPVGKVFIGIKVGDQETIVKELQLSGTREQIRLSSVKHATNLVARLLKESQDL
jgi:nicotinamide-nucleotide amidase